jgi:hypothetical protein
MTKEELVRKAKEHKALEDKQIAAAKAFVPDKYHQFIQLIEDNLKLADFAFTPEFDEMAELGIYTIAGKCPNDKGVTLLRTKKPYFPVDGRVKWFNDEHVKPEGGRYKYSMESNITQINDLVIKGEPIPINTQIVVKIDSELFGLLEGNATVFTADYGINKTNPLENGYTSALGRCIGSTGIGVLPGAGLASSDEVILAKEVQKAQKAKRKSAGKTEDPSGTPAETGNEVVVEGNPANESNPEVNQTEGDPDAGQSTETAPGGETETTAQDQSNAAEAVTETQGDNQVPATEEPKTGSEVNTNSEQSASDGPTGTPQSENTWMFVMCENAVVGTTPGNKKRHFGGGRAVDYPNSEKVYKLIGWDTDADLFNGVKENDLIEVTGVKGYNQKPGGAGEHSFTVKTLKNLGRVKQDQMAS